MLCFGHADQAIKSNVSLFLDDPSAFVEIPGDGVLSGLCYALDLHSLPNVRETVEALGRNGVVTLTLREEVLPPPLKSRCGQVAGLRVGGEAKIRQTKQTFTNGCKSMQTHMQTHGNLCANP